MEAVTLIKITSTQPETQEQRNIQFKVATNKTAKNRPDYGITTLLIIPYALFCDI